MVRNPLDPLLAMSKEAADTGERFDPFCHTLDEQGRALCFADVRGRQVHQRSYGTSSSAGPSYCSVCQRALCPTCREIEARAGGAT